ncbi:transposase [Pontibacter rugosus]|uniref:Transposase n=1 Tax=Pontibacter rugosus TaxID=1745966 RepID=A0ABW3SNT8_9BACT
MQNIASTLSADEPLTESLYAKKTQNIASLRFSDIGGIANQYWQDIPKHFPFVELDMFVVMPNHVHGILFINKLEHEEWKPNKFGPQSQNLASIVRGYKAGVKKYATLHQLDFGWQSRYYDRVIRSEKELQNIRQYIFNNPAKWEAEKNNPENLLM